MDETVDNALISGPWKAGGRENPLNVVDGILRSDPASKSAQKKDRDATRGKRTIPTNAQLEDPVFYPTERPANQEAEAADGNWHHFHPGLKQ